MGYLVLVLICQGVHPQLILNDAICWLVIHKFAKVSIMSTVHRETDDGAMATRRLLGDVYV